MAQMYKQFIGGWRWLYMDDKGRTSGGGAGDGAGCVLICFFARDKVVSSHVSTTNCCFGGKKKKETVAFLLKIPGFALYSSIEFRCSVPIK